jgi:hypothetical protein
MILMVAAASICQEPKDIKKDDPKSTEVKLTIIEQKELDDIKTKMDSLQKNLAMVQATIEATRQEGVSAYYKACAKRKLDPDLYDPVVFFDKGQFILLPPKKEEKKEEKKDK